MAKSVENKAALGSMHPFGTKQFSEYSGDGLGRKTNEEENWPKQRRCLRLRTREATIFHKLTTLSVMGLPFI